MYTPSLTPKLQARTQSNCHSTPICTKASKLRFCPVVFVPVALRHHGECWCVIAASGALGLGASCCTVPGTYGVAVSSRSVHFFYSCCDITPFRTLCRLARSSSSVCVWVSEPGLSPLFSTGIRAKVSGCTWEVELPDITRSSSGLVRKTPGYV